MLFVTFCKLEYFYYILFFNELYVIILSRVSGLSPFMGEDDVETMTNVTLGKYDFNDDVFDSVSENGKDFIKRLLTKDVT